MSDYCKTWNLEVNLTKTKVVIFSKGNVTKHIPFLYDGKNVDVVHDYKYLGVVFNRNGSFKKAISKQIAQAKKAMYAILQKARILKLPIDIVCQLYEACVIPVLLYGSEIWGYECLKSLEIFHRRFLRIILNYYNFSPNCMLYGETNSLDIKTKVYIRMISYWLKLLNSDVLKLSSVICKKFKKDMDDSKPSYDMDESNLSIPNPNEEFVLSYKWLKKVKGILDSTGFSHVWLSDLCVQLDFLKEFKQRCHDLFVQNWRSDMNSNSQCSVYRLHKEAPKVEDFMLNLDYVHRLRLSKFISRVHNLPVTSNRFAFKENDPLTLCPLCDINCIGDESHYLFKCSYFDSVRKNYLPDKLLNVRNDMSSLWKILLNLDTKSLVKVSKFVKII